MTAPNTLHATLAEAAARWPGAVAVVDDATWLDYATLLRAVDARAAALLRRCRTGDPVGVLLECSAQTVISYFACLRAGLLYTPLIEHPPAVLDALVARLGLAAVVTDRTLSLPLPCLHPRDDGAPAAAAFPATDPAAPAHLLPTSGTTTGTPRSCLTDQTGSLLSHAWRAALCPYQADDVVGCNVFGIWDVVPALQCGVPAVMIADAVLRDPVALAGAVVRHGITRIMLTPSLLGACLASPAAVAALRRLRLVVLCGEVPKPAVLDRARDCLPHTRLLDLYSLSECHDVAAGFVDRGATRLRPAPFADVRVVDRRDRSRRVAPGGIGRVIVGGPGVALGYAGREPGGFHERDGSRFYDTGDLARLHADGTISLVGRADAGVKVRGRWVDPGEVAAVLAAHPDVVDAGVELIDGRLTAAVVGRGADLPRRLRLHAVERLPAHAVPDRIEPVARLGLSAAGKATGGAAGAGAGASGDVGDQGSAGAGDRDRAGAGDRGSPGAGAEASAGMSDARLQSLVVEAFRDVLDDCSIGLDVDFVDAGGNSLDAIELCGRLQELTHRPVRVADLLRVRRPKAVARLLSATDAAPEEAWRLPREVPAIVRAGEPRAMRHPLVTGASGHLGGLVARALDGRCETLARPAMDLDQPLLGLSRREFDSLGRRIDGIVHTAAAVDPFAGFEALYRTNVLGTLELVRLAGIAGVPLHFVSSSAALPLGGGKVWTPDAQPSERLARALKASGADAYSFTKLAAEFALWRAAGQGLPVRIVRVPHVIGHPRRDRLLQTLAALVAAGVYPQVAGQWQFVTAEAVREALLEPPRADREIRHVAFAPVALAQVVERLGLDLEPVPAAAVATALRRVPPGRRHRDHARALLQLVAEHGPLRALSLADALLGSRVDDGWEAFERAFMRFDG